MVYWCKSTKIKSNSAQSELFYQFLWLIHEYVRNRTTLTETETKREGTS